MLLDDRHYIAEVDSGGVNFTISDRPRIDSQSSIEWYQRSLDFNIERGMDGNILVSLSCGGLSNSAKRHLLDMFLQTVDEAIGYM